MKILFETFCVGVAVAILTQMVISPPTYGIVVFFATWLAVSLLAGAGWSVMRGRQKSLATYNEFMSVAETIRAQQIRHDVARVARELKSSGRPLYSYYKPRPGARDAAIKQRDLYRHAAAGGPGVSLSRADLKKVNEQRRAKGLPMMSQQGFAQAIATAPASASMSHVGSNHWLFYFLTFDCPAKHVSLSLSGDPGADVLIQPVGGGHGGVWSGGEAPGVVLMPEPEAAAALKAGDYDMPSGTLDSVSY
jgi:hypothetical protein